MELTKITGQVFNLIMKIFFFLLGFVIIPCSCILNPLRPPKPIVYPDKDLREVRIGGGYDSLTKKFKYAGWSSCYNKEKNKELIFNKNFKVRIYDKKNKLLAEDSLRLTGDNTETHRLVRGIPEEVAFSYSYVRAYIPYYEEGDKILLIRLEGSKEIILSKFTNIYSQEELRKLSQPERRGDKSDRRKGRYLYDDVVECHDILHYSK